MIFIVFALLPIIFFIFRFRHYAFTPFSPAFSHRDYFSRHQAFAFAAFSSRDVFAAARFMLHRRNILLLPLLQRAYGC